MQFGRLHHKSLVATKHRTINAVFGGEGGAPRVYLSRAILLSVDV